MNFKKLTTLVLSTFLVASTIPTTNVFADEPPNLLEKEKPQEVITSNNSQLFQSMVESSKEIEGDFEYSINDDNTITITRYIGTDNEVIIPSEINGKVVTSIGDNTFAQYSSLTKIKLPDSITSIGNFAFVACRGLTSIELPDSIVSIGDSAFGACTELTNIKLSNSITSIGDSAFIVCTGLTSIELPDSIVSIGQSAFKDCRRLTNIELPDSITSIGEEAFRGCYNLVIKCYENSYAHTYAVENKIKFILISKDMELQEAIEKANSVKDSNNTLELMKAVKDLANAIVKYNK